MLKLSYFILSAIVYCAGIHAAAAQIREISERAAIMSAITAWGHFDDGRDHERSEQRDQFTDQCRGLQHTGGHRKRGRVAGVCPA